MRNRPVVSRRSHWLALLALSLCAAPTQAEPLAKVWQFEMLQKHGIEPNAAGAIRLLERRLLAAERERIDGLVKQLGSDDYGQRETASRALIELGPAAKGALIEANSSDDLETVLRSRQILQRLSSSNAELVDEALDLAALYVLERQPTPDATDPLLATLPRLRERYLQDAACEALWACVDKRDEPHLRKAIASGDAATKAAALVALEIVCGEACIAELRGYLNDADEMVRLATARALIDRLPRKSLTTLAGLLVADDPATRMQAERLLRLATGVEAKQNESSDAARARLMQWVVKNAATAPLEVPLGEARLQLAADRLSFYEDFSRDAPSIDRWYGRFHYETDVAGKAVVADGTLKLQGDHAEGDQRLLLAATRVVGRATFPRSLRVRTEIGGEAENSGAWHAGVSVGNVRLLLHPGYPGGAFRIERVDNKAALVGNQNMPFTPAAGTLYEMTIDVQPAAGNKILLATTIVDANDERSRFAFTHEVARSDVGELDRIGLERSGRTGGAALFGSLSIRELPPAAE